MNLNMYAETPQEKQERMQREKEAKEREKLFRVFPISNEERNKMAFPTNQVRTTKYHQVIYLYKALVAQCMRLPVMYFIAMTVLEVITAISPYNPIPNFVTLVFVICLAAIREAFEDIERYKMDLKVNTTFTVKYTNGRWNRVGWKDIIVGDIIRIKANEFVPADCVCLATSNYNGAFYLQTNFLDGKTTLQRKQTVNSTNEIIGNGEIFRLVGEAEMNTLSSDMEEFDGMILIGEDIDAEFTEKNYLPRGAVLRNTDWVIGLVGYTGLECKIYLNQSPNRAKVSKVERVIDVGLFMIIGLQFVAGLIMGVLAGINASQVGGAYAELTGGSSQDFIVGLIGIFSFFILTNQMVPLVLILSLEMIRMTLCVFVKRDELMYSSQMGTYANVISSNILEELGQVKYVISDKTGTITNNKFQLKLMMIGAELYGSTDCLSDVVGFQSAVGGMPPVQDSSGDLEYVFEDDRLAQLWDNYMSENPGIDFRLSEKNTGKNVVHHRSQIDLVKEFLTFLALCNSCEVVLDENRNEVTYQGIYPDEVATTDAAKKLGAELVESGSFFKRVNVLGKEQYFEILKNIKFNSLRRRSTMIVKHKGVIQLYCKGETEVIYGLLSEHQSPGAIDNNRTLLGAAASRGLRVMCYGTRIISENEYLEFDKRVEKAMKNQNEEEKEKLISRSVLTTKTKLLTRSNTA